MIVECFSSFKNNISYTQSAFIFHLQRFLYRSRPYCHSILLQIAFGNFHLAFLQLFVCSLGNIQHMNLQNFPYTVFPLISAGPQISATTLGIYIEISTSLLISATPVNAVLIRVVTIFYLQLNQNGYGTSLQTVKQ